MIGERWLLECKLLVIISCESTLFPFRSTPYKPLYHKDLFFILLLLHIFPPTVFPYFLSKYSIAFQVIKL